MRVALLRSAKFARTARIGSFGTVLFDPIKGTVMNAIEMWEQSGLDGKYEAWAFGDAPDELADLVRRGVKTATCSAYALYEAEGEELPKKGEYSVILDSRDNAVCIIRTNQVTLTPFEEVTAEHAFKEGEGDRSLEYWRNVHEAFFKEELKEIHQEFDPKMILVCEEFEVCFQEFS